MSFFNPYLTQKTFLKKTSLKPKTEYTRIIPKCFRKQHSSGIISITNTAEPVCFVNNKQINILYDEGQKSIWTSMKPKATIQTLDEQPLTFHIYDIIDTVYTYEKCEEVPFKFQTEIIPSGTVLKLLGRTEDNFSVCVNVFGQQLYFYVKVQPGINIDFVIQQAINGGFNRNNGSAYQLTKTRKKILREYYESDCEVFKVTLSSTVSLNLITDRLEAVGCEIFESNVDAARRFIIDNNFSTFGWFHCPNAIPRIQHRDSWTDLEFDCHVCDLTFFPERTEWPMYNILSFDIECIGENGFPNAVKDEDMVLQISCVLWEAGTSKKPRNMLLNLGTCDPIEDTEVFECPSELDMFYLFFTLIRDYNIEFVTGYNISNFDFTYLIDRATQVYNFNLKDFTRVKSSSMFEVHKPRNSTAGFMRAMSKIKISGLVTIDMYIVCKDKLSLSNYKLNTVAKECVGEQKEDVSYKEIPSLFREGPKGRAKLGLYCVKDSVLVMDLLKFFMTHVEISEIAKIAKIPTRRVLTDGQQIRVFSCLLDVARQQNYILPVNKNVQNETYQGATVIDPIPGFYNTPVLVVDFASLYPTVIQAHNLCYSTMILNEKLHLYPDLKPGDYESFNLSSGPVHFVKKHKAVSLLATLLNVWLDKRRSIRKTLATETNASIKTILDKQQLAIKVTCNAVYGFTGVASGILPCLKIAETVTFQGRKMLEKSKDLIESITPEILEGILSRPVKCEPHAHFKVIYGDTDSLFSECIGFTADEVNSFCDRLAEYITQTLFTSPIKLEAEKTFQCLILLTKKRYIGIMTNGKLLMKGVDLVRKTACKFVQTTTKVILDLVMQDNDVRSAAQNMCSKKVPDFYSDGLPVGFLKVIDVLNESYKKLKNNNVPINHLTFSTELSRPISFYKTTNLPHLAVYNKMLSRNEELPQIHDRIQYVFIDSKCKLKSDMAEDPGYVSQNNIPLAVDLYFDKVIHGAANILQCLFENDSDKAVKVLYNFVDLPCSL
ncbi:DNA polymerase catalytic subunit [Vespertilionid gammaherpesvirus 1]|uniref:DNA polymerase n=1 Tax=Vespertilionid gammaherpesvirus 1 TaxID=2560830 RepID=A0A0X9Y7F8_9GAMA|nr:DNA polymerase catalytic subunit [Myotis gammaherpesvirus 8]AMA67369.1 DNA polymerase catalytic subunit [Vespertilionid gammaherpesvirus 1]